MTASFLQRGEAVARRFVTPGLIVLIAAVLFLLNWRLQYPGTLSPDLASQLQQARTGQLNDWHPPAMTRMWQLILPIAPGTGPLYTLGLLTYWSAFALLGLTLRRMGRPLFALVVVLAGGWPQFIALNVTIVKDSLLAAGVLLSFALVFDGLVRGATRAGRIERVAGVALLIASALLRHNAAIVVGPIVALALGWPVVARPVRTLLLAAVLTVTLIPAFTFANHHVFGAADARPAASLQIFDLAGIAARSGDASVFGPDSRVTMTDVEHCYTPVMWDTMSPWGRCGWLSARASAPIVDPTHLRGPAIDNGLGARWTAAILHHSVAYLGHRVAHFNRALFFVVPTAQARVVIVNPKEDVAQQRYNGSRVLYFFRNSVLVTPMTAMLLAGAVLTALIVACRRERAATLDAAAALALAGLLYGGFYLVVGVAADIRYFQLTAMAAIVALVVALSEPVFRRSVGQRRLLVSVLVGVLVGGLAIQLAARLVLPVAQPVQAQIPSER